MHPLSPWCAGKESDYKCCRAPPRENALTGCLVWTHGVSCTVLAARHTDGVAVGILGIGERITPGPMDGSEIEPGSSSRGDEPVDIGHAERQFQRSGAQLEALGGLVNQNLCPTVLRFQLNQSIDHGIAGDIAEVVDIKTR